MLHAAAAPRQALFVWDEPPAEWLTQRSPHRAIGVVYDPRAERWRNYVPTVLGRRYDAFCWFDETAALQPLRTIAAEDKETMGDLHRDQ